MTAVEPARMAPRLGGIEASRGIAAAMVVLYHVARHLDKGPGAPGLHQIFRFGHAGVDFFFVISGFIILFVHYDDIGRPAALAHYARRRFTRLIPTYWVGLILTIAMALAGHHAMPSAALLLWDASLLPADHDMLLGVAWTLRFEVLFYATFAVLILNRTLGFVAMAVWFSVSLVSPLVSAEGFALPYQFHSVFTLEFLLGMLVAVAVKRSRLAAPGWILGAGFALFAIAAVCEDLNVLGGYGDVARLFYGVPSALIVWGITEIDRQAAPRLPAMLRALGSASYSIYLFQFVFIGVAWQAMMRSGFDLVTPVIVQFVVLVFAALAGGVAMSVYVEYPLMALIRKRRAVGRAAAPAG